jgi:hypothetical protein
MTIVVNFFGGPGAGKSTTAAHVFAELKWLGYNCELVTEYAKDKVWENSIDVLRNQIYVFGKQYHKLNRASNHVDIVITDSPILLSLVYGKDMSENFRQMVLEEFNSFMNINFYLTRVKQYNPIGRTQTEYEARKLDDKVFLMLDEEGIHSTVVEGKRENVDFIVTEIISRISLLKDIKNA